MPKPCSSCHCCPYGFHIDRDFVRYCESLYNIAQLDKLKQRKKERRKEQMTLESCLGLNIMTCGNKDDKLFLPKTVRKSSGYNILADLDDDLFDVGDVWQRSVKKQEVSLSSDITNIVGIQRDVLANIREQMATSLKRMKELEEQVKYIPQLEVTVNSLNEEKKHLLHQLKTTNGNLESHKSSKLLGIPLPPTRNLKLNKNKLSAPAIASDVNENLQKKSFIDTQIISQLTVDDHVLDTKGTIETIEEKCFKSMGTSCSVLTREIGVGHVQTKCKSTGVGDKNVNASPCYFGCLQEKEKRHSVKMSSESPESDSDSVHEFQNSFLQQKSINRYPRKYVKSVSTSPTHIQFKDASLSLNKLTANVTEVEVKEASTLTDILMFDAVPKESAKIKKILKNKSTSCDYVMKFSKAVQVPVSKYGFYNKSVSIQTDCRQEEMFHHVGVGDCSIHDMVCVKCTPKSVRNISVGDFSVTNIVCDKCMGKKTHSRGCGYQSVTDVYCTRCELKQTETIGVGDGDVTKPTCKYCASLSSEKVFLTKGKTILLRSVGMNTDVEVQSANNKTQTIICDKCNTKSSSKIDSATSKVTVKNNELNAVAILKHDSTVLGDRNSASYQTFIRKVSQEAERKRESEISEASEHSVDDSASILTSLSDESIDDKNTMPETVNPLNVIDHEKFELSKELKAACKVLNDSLHRKTTGGENKMLTSLHVLKHGWFQVANKKDADPYTIEGYLDAFEEFSTLLLQHVVNFADSNGNTAIHYAVSYSNIDVVSIFIDSKVCDVNMRNEAGYTCMMLVALADLKNDSHFNIIQRLFLMGDVNIKAKQNGQTALMLAVSQGKLDIVKMLFEAGAEVNLQDNDGSTALMCAAEHGHIEIVRMLLSHPDCDPTVTDSDGSNALTIALEAGHKDIGLLIYANMNFSRGSSPHSSLKHKRRSGSRSTPPRTPTLRTPTSPFARSTSSLPSAFHFMN